MCRSAAPDRLDGSRPSMHRAPHPPTSADDQASKFPAEHILQHGFVQRQISHDLLELAVLLLQLLQPLHLRWHQPSILLPPRIERRLADPRLATHLTNRRALLRLAQNVGDLTLAELRSFHVSPRPPGVRQNWNFPAYRDPDSREQVTCFPSCGSYPLLVIMILPAIVLLLKGKTYASSPNFQFKFCLKA